MINLRKTLNSDSCQTVKLITIYIDNTSGCNVIDIKADNLDSNTTYYFSFYAINKFGTFTSEIKSFTTLE